MRRYLPFVIVGAVALLTLGSGIMLYRAKRLPILTIPKNHMASGMDGTESIHVRGQADAPVTLEEFGDFQCPACGTLAGAINQLEQDYHLHLRVIFRHFPLASHKHAREAAIAFNLSQRCKAQAPLTFAACGSEGATTRLFTQTRYSNRPGKLAAVAMPTRVTTLSLGRAGKDAQRRS
jgi:Thioredoxin